VLLLALLAPLHGDDAPLPRGELIPQVPCTADDGQHYALYLPQGYDPSRAWPIVYGFDASARGVFVVERFKVAAENRGYIVAVSNNSRNGPHEPNVVAANAMFRDTQSRLNIDRRRIVLTGCSGGAKFALSLGTQLDVAGLIACGSPCEPGNEPLVRPSVAVFGTAGIDDFNYPSMRHLHEHLSTRAVPNHLAIFDGGHTWLPAGLADDALLWMDIRAMSRGSLARDEAVLNDSLQRRLSAAATLPPPERLLELRSIAADFDGLLDTEAVVRDAETLSAKVDLKAWRKRELADADRQGEEMTLLFANAAAGDEDEVELHVADLEKRSKQTKNPAQRHIARRIISGTAVGAMEQARMAETRGDHAAAVRMTWLRTRVADTDPRAHFDLARAHARAGDRKAALAALERAAALGFDVARRAAVHRDFEALRTDPGFQRLTAGGASP